MTVFTPEENTEIVEKHPQVTDTLTEAEKNTAPSECHEKSGIFENAEDEPPRETRRTRAVNGFGLWSVMTFIGALLCFVTAVAGAPIAALFMAAALTLISGLTYALKGNSRKKRKTEAAAGGNPSSAVPPSAPAASENKNQGDNSDGNNRE